MERSQAFVQEGDEAFDSGDYREAVAKYRAAYDELDPAARVSYVGSIPMRNAMNAYAALLERDDDISVVQGQLSFLSEFLAEVEHHHAQEAVGEDVLSDLRELQATLEQRVELDRSKSSSPPPLLDPEGPSGAYETLNQPSDSVRPRRHRVGLGLVLGGTALMGTGTALLISGLSIPNQARRYADETPGFEMTEFEFVHRSTARDKYLADESVRAKTFLTGGLVVMVAGISALTAGSIEIAVQRRRAAAVSILPSLGRSGASLSFRARF